MAAAWRRGALRPSLSCLQLFGWRYGEDRTSLERFPPLPPSAKDPSDDAQWQQELGSINAWLLHGAPGCRKDPGRGELPRVCDLLRSRVFPLPCPSHCTDRGAAAAQEKGEVMEQGKEAGQAAGGVQKGSCKSFLQGDVKGPTSLQIKEALKFGVCNVWPKLGRGAEPPLPPQASAALCYVPQFPQLLGALSTHTQFGVWNPLSSTAFPVGCAAVSEPGTSFPSWEL